MKVVQVFPEEGNLGLVLPRDLSKWTMDKVRKEGIEVHPGNAPETAVIEDGKVKVRLSGGEEVCVCVTVWQIEFESMFPCTHTHTHRFVQTMW